ncbi:Arf-domain-containing protein [Pleurotus eryngii]|uniref:Arf-domain-containing protein n=1 Tax=Pleurotus eryngii TaxID=5323 RepID=A0A9P5ZRM6_PLEER|nr:Arf-domain-containing protein [Pleurotus eryngii]
MSSLRNLITRLFSSQRKAYTVSILGLDYSGKTTLLYKLKLGEVVQTIPSIGFTVEEVEVSSAAGGGEELRMVCWDIGAGCGGFMHMKKLISMCIERTNAIVWMVDSNDRPRVKESVEILKEILGLTSFVNGQVPILVLANKQDTAGSMSLDEIRKAFAPPLAGYTFNVFRCSCLQDLPKSGIPEAFYWLRLVLQLSPTSSNVTKEPSVPTSGHVDLQNGGLAEKLDAWVTRASSDVPADEYLSLFEAVNLPSWDHYAHVRIAYIILTKFGRQKGKDLIFNGIEHYIKESGQAGGRTFHLTMTYLWIQLVHFGIQNTTASLPSSAPPSDKSPNLLPPSMNDFARFLLLNSYVVDGNIWSNYYSKDVIMTPAAKAGLVLPDKKPLPSILSRDAV